MVVGKSTSDQPDLPDALLEEAVRWHARMREPGASETVRGRFQRWLSADARHTLAYKEAEQLWKTLEQPVARVMAAEPTITQPAVRPQMTPMRWAGMSATACLLLLLGFGACWETGVYDDLRSDYVTAVGTQRTVILADGSHVTLNTNTAMAVAFEPDRRIVRLYRGEAWFDVTHNAARPFIVGTPEGNVRVTGTRFNVRLVDDEAIVSLVEGRVELTDQDDPSNIVVVAPGEQGIIRAGSIGALGTFDVNTVTAWQRGQLVFYKVPLAEVVEQLNRYRSGRIVLANSALDSLKVTGVFDAGHPNQALSVIQNTLHISALRLTNRLILLR